MSRRDQHTGSSWLEQAKGLLDESAEGLDAATLSRLNRARQAALHRRRPSRRWALPAGLVSACMLLLVLSTWHAYVPHDGAAPDLPVTKNAAGDLDLVSSDDSLEFYQDLEFYAWLEAQDQDLGS